MSENGSTGQATATRPGITDLGWQTLGGNPDRVWPRFERAEAGSVWIDPVTRDSIEIDANDVIDVRGAYIVDVPIAKVAERLGIRLEGVNDAAADVAEAIKGGGLFGSSEAGEDDPQKHHYGVEHLANRIRAKSGMCWVAGPLLGAKYLSSNWIAGKAWLLDREVKGQPTSPVDFAWKTGIDTDIGEDCIAIARWLWSLGYHEVVTGPGEVKPETLLCQGRHVEAARKLVESPEASAEEIPLAVGQVWRSDASGNEVEITGIEDGDIRFRYTDTRESLDRPESTFRERFPTLISPEPKSPSRDDLIGHLTSGKRLRFERDSASECRGPWGRVLVSVERVNGWWSGIMSDQSNPDPFSELRTIGISNSNSAATAITQYLESLGYRFAEVLD